MSSSDESDDKLTMLEDIRDVSQFYPIINSREARYNIRGCIK